MDRGPLEGARFPRRFKKVYIEIGRSCNLRCGWCPGARPGPAGPGAGRGPRSMGPALFERVVAGVAPLAEQAYFHLLGEPLAHPRFAEYVGLCSRRGLPVNITTNGTLLGGARAEALLDPIVRQVSFSLHGFIANSAGRDIGPYLAAIFEFTRRAFEVRPDLYVNYRLWNLAAADEAANAPIIARVERAFGVELKGGADVRWRKGRRVAGRLYLHFDTRFDWPSLSAPPNAGRGTCRGLDDHFGVLSDGTVVPCCLDADGVIALGDLNRQTVAEVLAGERCRAMERGFREGRLVEDLCRRCAYIARFARGRAASSGTMLP
ncbi:MAG: SPASM domain-containing protein [Elusimicrobia bacterium]|nr:SPASM domain-containing protein [Elusimicrobiota bacterium]